MEKLFSEIFGVFHAAIDALVKAPDASDSIIVVVKQLVIVAGILGVIALATIWLLA